ncbi:MAG: VanZ family protein [FCB group bacterium]|jgi:VanZ family protein
MKYKIYFTLPAVIIAIILFFLSAQSELPHIDFGFVWSDKVEHIIAYFGYGLSLIFAVFGNSTDIKLKKGIIIVLIIGGLFGASDELHQLYVPGRDCSFFDWLADVIGISLSLPLINIIKKLFIFRIIKNQKLN